MPRSGWFHFATLFLSFCAVLIGPGCEPKATPTVETTSGRRAADVAAERLAQASQPSSDVPVRMAAPTDTRPAPSFESIQEQIPDPLVELETVRAEVANLPAELARIDAEIKNPATNPVRRQTLENKKLQLIERPDSDQRLITRLESIRRPHVVRLTLQEAIRRALLNSHSIQVAAYNPAIEAGRVVEAEAQFDAVFYSTFTSDKQNRPSSSQLSGTDTQTTVWEAGVRKLLSSGMQVSTGYNVNRSKTDLVFQTLNPAYFNQFFVEFRQPLLKGFGLDYNRSQIELRKLDRGISEEQLQRQIRETLYNVEEAYWRLFQARRTFTATARLLTDLETVLNSLQQRYKLGFDIYLVQVKLTESRYEQRTAEFVRLRNQIKTAEDALKALINDPDLNQAKDLEIIPVVDPNLQPLVLDVLGEVTAALNFRSELREARLQIAQAQVAIGAAKNQALPQLDLAFRYMVDGLGANWDRAFSQLSQNDFHEYQLQLELQWPIGARAGEAALRQARLRQAQAVASHRAQIEQVIVETQTAIRDLHSAYDQIQPNLRAAQAATDQLMATLVRQPARDLPNLQVELDAHELLATSRQTLVQALADYNIAIINLERRKGTLLKFNNIVLNPIHDDTSFEPYRPIGP